eukprot:CAMPEP_0174714998 /NCGR_PEP_ID=MMETSP1094-20130205/19778_1 /TAXON_ID=156173 /ORGANISM="Chrysochromulina brevifilum, Strain UTEX LB 985" /LENGTH=215 /DNA_ID=CAMNT_0015914481 /DNA_START=91 /DNA_END=738 /DNA_ORIENTATION=-
MLATLAIVLAPGMVLDGHVMSSSRGCSRCRAAPSMGLFDSLAKAFDNDDTLGESGPAGLKTKAQVQTLTWVGPKPEGPAAIFEKQPVTESGGIAGQPLKVLAEAAGIPIQYSCMKGTCGLCFVKVDGVEVAACTAVCPKKDVTIEYMDDAGAKTRSREIALATKAKRQESKAKTLTGKVVPTATDEPPAKSYRERMEEEMLASMQQKKKGGWPFG